LKENSISIEDLLDANAVDDMLFKQKLADYFEPRSFNKSSTNAMLNNIFEVR